MSWLSPKHLDDASRILRGVALVLAKAAIDRWVGVWVWVVACGDSWGLDCSVEYAWSLMRRSTPIAIRCSSGCPRVSRVRDCSACTCVPHVLTRHPFVSLLQHHTKGITQAGTGRSTGGSQCSSNTLPTAAPATAVCFPVSCQPGCNGVQPPGCIPLP